MRLPLAPRSALAAAVRTAAVLAALAVAALAAAGCETSVDPVVDGDRPFSLFGHLDASSDTQYVRVTPLRPTLPTTPAPLDAVVTLEDVATGRVTVLRDSVFAYGDGRYAHNVWTTEPVRLRRTYRLTAARPDGAASRATVTLPDSFGIPALYADTWIRDAAGGFVRGQQVVASGIARLVDVRVAYEVVWSDAPDRAERFVFPHMDRASAASGRFTVSFLAGDDLRRIAATRSGARPRVRGVEVTVAAAGPEWPDGLDPDLIGLPNAGGNVAGGLGFVGGVVSQTWTWCELRRLAGGAPCTACEIEELLGGPPCPP